MIIIAAKNGFLKERTGVEEYTFQLIKHLVKQKTKEKFLIFTNKIEENIDLPSNFNLKIIRWPIFWTQIGLSLEILKLRIRNYELRIRRKLTSKSKRPVSSLQEPAPMALFIPAHVMPLIHLKNTTVTIHGLEYEYYPAHYSWLSRKYLRWSTTYTATYASKIITVSENTKKDLIDTYKCDPKKIDIVYHGVDKNQESRIRRTFDEKLENLDEKRNHDSKFQIPNSRYFLYLGRIETKKNILGTIRAFEIFKSQYPKARSQKLILAGGRGHGFKQIIDQISKLNDDIKKDIVFMGHVTGEQKEGLLRGAKALIFPSFYEGFGLPILEAQSRGVPVITSKGSSTEEVAGDGAIIVDPGRPEEIVDAMLEIINNKSRKEELIEKGYENCKRFSWQKCAKETLGIINSI